MFEWEDFSNLLVVKRLKHLIDRWWNMDVLILKAEELLPGAEPLHPPEFQNPALKQLFKIKKARETLFKMLYTASDLKTQGPVLKTWPLTGVRLYILPVQFQKPLTGSVVLAGFFENREQKEKARGEWGNLGLNREETAQHLDGIPLMENQDKKYLLDMGETLSREILTVQSEMIEKKQNLRSMNQKAGGLCYGDLIGRSRVMKELYNLLDRICHSHNTILIQGENGTGKELIAKSIHENSPRKNETFVAQNCSALNDNLLESELFGHVRGAFTGAYKDKKGLFEVAHRGTFLLDEIGDTSPGMQVKILRVLQEGTFYPVGGVAPKKVDVRIIAATNKNLKQMIEEGSFREDLYYRLNVINIQAPPLRERKEDIPLLAEYFLNRNRPAESAVKVFTKKALARLIKYPWPGNVRELQNEADRLAVFSGSESYIQEDFLSDKIKNQEEFQNLNSFFNKKKGQIIKTAVADLERRLIARCLVEEGWNKSRVAKKLGLSRAALISKIKDYRLQSSPPSRKMIIRRGS